MLVFSFKEQTALELFSLDHSGFIHRGYKNKGEARLQFAPSKDQILNLKDIIRLILNAFQHESK